MSTFLLDVNVLLAMAWPEHDFYAPAKRWFIHRRGQSWATCPLTEAGFVRLSARSQVVRLKPAIADAISALEDNRADPDHVFWPQDSSLPELLPEIRARLFGHQQISDALLLDLAIRRGGIFVTLDQRIPNLLPLNSPHRAAIEIIPAP